MLWAPDNIAWFALQAGWPRAEVALAVAHAVLATEGDSAYQWPDPPTSYASRSGLWAVGTYGWDQDRRAALASPLAAAEDAWRRHQASQGDWRWSPVAGTRDVELLAGALAGIENRATPVLALDNDPRTMRERRDLAGIETGLRQLRGMIGNIRYPQ